MRVPRAKKEAHFCLRGGGWGCPHFETHPFALRARVGLRKWPHKSFFLHSAWCVSLFPRYQQLRFSVGGSKIDLVALVMAWCPPEILQLRDLGSFLEGSKIPLPWFTFCEGSTSNGAINVASQVHGL